MQEKYSLYQGDVIYVNTSILQTRFNRSLVIFYILDNHLTPSPIAFSLLKTLDSPSNLTYLLTHISSLFLNYPPQCFLLSHPVYLLRSHLLQSFPFTKVLYSHAPYQLHLKRHFLKLENRELRKQLKKVRLLMHHLFTETNQE